MSLFRHSDYYKEAKKFREKTPRRASHGGISTSKRVGIPTQMRSRRQFCRNCQNQLESGSTRCKQCGKDTVPLRRRK